MATIRARGPPPAADNWVPEPEASPSGDEPVPLRRTIDDDEVRLGPPRLELLTASQEAEAVELLAALLAAAARQPGARPLKEAA
jgi:hypothetical protein